MAALVIPLDASQIPDGERKEQRVRVGALIRGKIVSEVVTLERGKAEVKLNVDNKQPITVAVGPESASDEDLFHLETLTSTVTAAQWADRATLTLPPYVITPAWWRLWLRWCRIFTITGRVVCPDGTPVPGAEVRAYDVDFFWWWSSIAQVNGSAITDAAGHFTIKFKWCCGWWPWWWWRLKKWRVDPDLLGKIRPVVTLNPRIPIPEPDPIPRWDIATLNPQPLPPKKLPPGIAMKTEIDPASLPVLRERLLAALPHVPELERLRIWPWWPWTPWIDCAPDLIFRVTQVCNGTMKTIVNENVFQTHFNVSTNEDVTLVAKDACCVPIDDPPPDGDCVVITGVCGDPGITVPSIAQAGPLAGYADPNGRDRPFAETISLSGQFGTGAQADFYEIEHRPHGAGPWTPVPPASLVDFNRGYFDSNLVWPNQFVYPVPFPAQTFGALHVYESRHHYEATHPPPNWGSAMTGRAWYHNVNTLAVIDSSGNFADGAWDFRIVGYMADANGEPNPATRKVLDGCGNHPNNNLIVLRFDNRIVGPPTPGSVHVNTTEPDCGILSVKIGGSTVLPCGAEQLQGDPPLDIEFFVTDPDGHLDHYEIRLKYDLGSVKDLLNPADTGPQTLTAITAGASQGPNYSNAVGGTQTSTRPSWTGGTMRLHIDHASQVFPKTCCYLVELTVWKRNIVDCDGDLNYYNQMHYSFTVTI